MSGLRQLLREFETLDMTEAAKKSDQLRIRSERKIWKADHH